MVEALGETQKRTEIYPWAAGTGPCRESSRKDSDRIWDVKMVEALSETHKGLESTRGQPKRSGD